MHYPSLGWGPFLDDFHYTSMTVSFGVENKPNILYLLRMNLFNFILNFFDK